jgi:NAD-dependent DNA ligase
MLKNYDEWFTDQLDSVAGKNNWKWNDSNTEVVLIQDNSEVLFKTVLHFFESLKVDQLKEASLKKIFDKYNLYDYEFENAIYFILDMVEGEWIRVIGANGSKIHASILDSLSNTTIQNLIGPTPFFGVGTGVRKIEMLIEQLHDQDDFWIIALQQLQGLYGFDQKTALKIYNGIPRAKKFFDTLVSQHGASFGVKKVKTSELSGVVAVFTGFRDSILEQQIKDAGGRVASSVSGKVTHVVAADPSNKTGKVQEAISRGITVISLEDFKEEFDL